MPAAALIPPPAPAASGADRAWSELHGVGPYTPPLLPFPAEYRIVDDIAFCREGMALSTAQKAWFRVTEDLGADPRLHQAALAFCSDMILLSSAMRPHAVRKPSLSMNFA